MKRNKDKNELLLGWVLVFLTTVAFFLSVAYSYM